MPGSSQNLARPRPTGQRRAGRRGRGSRSGCISGSAAARRPSCSGPAVRRSPTDLDPDTPLHVALGLQVRDVDRADRSELAAERAHRVGPAGAPRDGVDRVDDRGAEGRAAARAGGVHQISGRGYRARSGWGSQVSRCRTTKSTRSAVPPRCCRRRRRTRAAATASGGRLRRRGRGSPRRGRRVLGVRSRSACRPTIRRVPRCAPCAVASHDLTEQVVAGLVDANVAARQPGGVAGRDQFLGVRGVLEVSQTSRQTNLARRPRGSSRSGRRSSASRLRAPPGGGRRVPLHHHRPHRRRRCPTPRGSGRSRETCRLPGFVSEAASDSPLARLATILQRHLQWPDHCSRECTPDEQCQPGFDHGGSLRRRQPRLPSTGGAFPLAGATLDLLNHAPAPAVHPAGVEGVLLIAVHPGSVSHHSLGSSPVKVSRVARFGADSRVNRPCSSRRRRRRCCPPLPQVVGPSGVTIQSVRSSRSEVGSLLP
ncbi:hypothetical protein Q3G72_008828 [Acer saccharum]|nr:hypothetical protein Q3G72_008828 [Acer saccharum]